MITKVLIPRIQKDSSLSDSSCDVTVRTSSTPGRKRKLDHLSVEEKIQRKKLKNRVAAQTSRDRKKKQMEEMVVMIEKYEKEVSHWRTKFNQMQTKYEKLEKENRKLKANLLSHNNNNNNNIVKKDIITHSIPEEHKYTRSFVEDTKSEDRCVDSVVIKTEGPAASSEPLQKVIKMNTESTEKSPKKYSQHKMNDVKALLKVVLLCLLYKNSSKTSTCNSTLKNLQKVLSLNSNPTSKQILQWAIAQMPKKKATNSSCLDQWWTSKCLGPQNREWNPPKIAIGAQ
ncbi:uncharacterized protein Xbp1 [Chironomus tepperi]|uniref:uncharacterized protein Xbp1 n=1 Tax=Chironomus tepperi TaxID=113505 RepID=UPI00391F2F11